MPTKESIVFYVSTHFYKAMVLIIKAFYIQEMILSLPGIAYYKYNHGAKF